ncbi:MAG TPA: 50S ribosomal protein L21 [Candidatus Kapabacteria bacterium]|nr:50S ribosomal protein L21 [Candidatus Kapabacteria bacterium]HPO61637.1 50S ribosomal protein L21 [Candidatus Kapabacteria bacterium]
MFAVVEIGGQQFNVQKEQIVSVPLLNADAGDIVKFSNLLLLSENDSIKYGSPYTDGCVVAKVLEHWKDEKILVFHKKRRKGHRKLNGHRQKYTKIQISDISASDINVKTAVVDDSTPDYLKIENN